MDTIQIITDALTKAREERDAANAALFEAGVMYGDTLRQRDAARALVRRLVAAAEKYPNAGLIWDVVVEARAAVAKWGPS